MKLSGFLMLSVLLQVFPGECQTLSISGKSVPMKEILGTIKSQAGVVFFYEGSVLRQAKPVTIDCKNVTLETALNEVFKGQSLTWLLEGKTVTIFKSPVQIILAEPVFQDPELREHTNLNFVSVRYNKDFSFSYSSSRRQ